MKLYLLDDRIFQESKRAAFDAILERSEYIRMRRIRLGSTVLSNLFSRIERTHMAEFRHRLNFFGRSYSVNPWFELSIRKMTVDGPLNSQTVFWKMKYLNELAKQRTEQ